MLCFECVVESRWYYTVKLPGRTRQVKSRHGATGYGQGAKVVSRRTSDWYLGWLAMTCADGNLRARPLSLSVLTELT